MRGRRLKLEGQKFERLTVLEDIGRYHGAVLWHCRCDCGKIVSVPSTALRNGKTKSCGCYRQDSMRIKQTTHGQTGSIRYGMLKVAKRRSAEAGLPFSLTLDDIPEIPELCPILGIPLVRQTRMNSTMFSCPALDRIIPSKGYVRGNIQVISQRANVIKNDATMEEVMKVALYMKGLKNE